MSNEGAMTMKDCTGREIEVGCIVRHKLHTEGEHRVERVDEHFVYTTGGYNRGQNLLVIDPTPAPQPAVLGYDKNSEPVREGDYIGDPGDKSVWRAESGGHATFVQSPGGRRKTDGQRSAHDVRSWIEWGATRARARELGYPAQEAESIHGWRKHPKLPWPEALGDVVTYWIRSANDLTAWIDETDADLTGRGRPLTLSEVVERYENGGCTRHPAEPAPETRRSEQVPAAPVLSDDREYECDDCGAAIDEEHTVSHKVSQQNLCVYCEHRINGMASLREGWCEKPPEPEPYEEHGAWESCCWDGDG